MASTGFGGNVFLLARNLGIHENIEAPVWAKNQAALREMSLLVIPRLEVNNSVKSIDGLCCQLSFAETRKRTQSVKPSWDFFDAPGMDGRCSTAVAGQEGLQEVCKFRSPALPDNQSVWLHAQRLSHEPGECYLASPLEVWHSTLQ